MALPHKFSPHETVGIAKELGMEEKFGAGEEAVYEHRSDPDKITLLQRHRSMLSEHFISQFEGIGFSRQQIEEAYGSITVSGQVP